MTTIYTWVCDCKPAMTRLTMFSFTRPRGEPDGHNPERPRSTHYISGPWKRFWVAGTTAHESLDDALRALHARMEVPRG